MEIITIIIVFFLTLVIVMLLSFSIVESYLKKKANKRFWKQVNQKKKKIK